MGERHGGAEPRRDARSLGMLRGSGGQATKVSKGSHASAGGGFASRGVDTKLRTPSFFSDLGKKVVGWKLGLVVGRVKSELRSFLGSILGVEYDYEVRFSRSDAYLLENRGFWFDFLRIHVDPGIFGGDFLESGFLENGWGGFWGRWWVGSNVS